MPRIKPEIEYLKYECFKIIHSIISSTITSAVLLVIFAISIAAATFVENDFGIPATRSLVYNSKWFEALLLVSYNILIIYKNFAL